jgi:putative MATE family efflux protein
MVAGIFAITTFNLVDMFFVARLGTNELAAMGFIFPVVMFVQSIALGLGIGTASVVSRAIGEGDHRKVRRLTTDSLILAVLLVVLFVAVGLFTINPLFTLMGAGPGILPLIREYMTIWYVGMIFVTVPMVGNNAIRATGDTKYPSLIMMISAGINVVLDPLLIFGLLRFPRLEIAGAALATVIARAFSLALSLAILHFREKMLDFSLPRLREAWDSWKRILYVGIPSAATNILTPLSWGVVILIVAHQFGAKAVAAVGAGTRVEMFALIVLVALETALIPFIGQNWAAGKFERVCLAQKYTSLFALWWGLLCVTVFLFTAAPIARVFNPDPEVTDNIISYLWIVPLGFGLQGIARLASASFNAINKPLSAAALSLVRMFVLYIPLAFIGGRLFGLRGLFGGICLANILAGIIALLWLAYERRTEKGEL